MTFIDNNETELQAEHEAQKAEAAAAKKIQEEAEREENHKKWLAQNEQERAKRRARELPHIKKIAEAMNTVPLHVERGVASVTEDGKLVISIEGFKVDLSGKLNFQERRERTSTWSRHAGKLLGWSLTVGVYGERRTYPQKKDGAYSYDKIAYQLHGEVAGLVRTKKAELARQDNTSVAKKFLTDHPGLSDYWAAMRVNASTVEGRGTPLDVKIEIKGAMSQEKAHALYEVLVAQGFVVVKKEG